ncbi:hypothetical protein D3C71_2041660 [compost metagenome]
MGKDQILGPLEAFRIKNLDKNIFGEHDKQRQSDRQPACTEDTGDHKGKGCCQEQLNVAAEQIHQ